MAGHGLRARRPAALTQRPFDAEARATGALRMDGASPDPAYREAVRETFYGDVDPVTAEAAIALLTPDAPVGISAGVTALTADGWGSIPRTYMVCTRDATIPRPCSASSSPTRMPRSLPIRRPCASSRRPTPLPVDARSGRRHRA